MELSEKVRNTEVLLPPEQLQMLRDQVADEIAALEADNKEADRLLLAAAFKYTGLEARLSKMEARLEYAEDVLGNVGMDDTLDYLEESWPLAGGE